LHSDGFSAPAPNCVHWGGFGGSWCVMDPDSGISVAYAMNMCVANEGLADPRQERLWEALRAVLMAMKQEMNID